MIWLCFIQTEPEPRKSLYKLRTTWPPYLSKRKLAAIDRHVHALDPNWPIAAVDSDPIGASIFVNPKFIEVRCVYSYVFMSVLCQYQHVYECGACVIVVKTMFSFGRCRICYITFGVTY